MPKEPEAPAPCPRRRLLQRVAAAALLPFALLVLACTEVPDRDPASGCANCPVCLHNADLACVCVKIGPDTPKAEWDGRTWYFCSEECRQAFLNDPKRFHSTGGTR